MSEFRSQILKAQASVSRVARCFTTYDKEIRKIYRAPLLPQEVDDSFAAYSDCAVQDIAKRARRFPRKCVPKYCGQILDDQAEYNFRVYNEGQPFLSEESFSIAPLWDQELYEPAGSMCGPCCPVYIHGPHSLN